MIELFVIPIALIVIGVLCLLRARHLDKKRRAALRSRAPYQLYRTEKRGEVIVR